MFGCIKKKLLKDLVKSGKIRIDISRKTMISDMITMSKNHICIVVSSVTYSMNGLNIIRDYMLNKFDPKHPDVTYFISTVIHQKLYIDDYIYIKNNDLDEAITYAFLMIASYEGMNVNINKKISDSSVVEFSTNLSITED